MALWCGGRKEGEGKGDENVCQSLMGQAEGRRRKMSLMTVVEGECQLKISDVCGFRLKP